MGIDDEGSLKTWLENCKKRVLEQEVDVFSWWFDKSLAKIENKRYFAIQGTINYQITDNFVD